MRKKITLLILLTLLFTSFSIVKAEESLPNLVPTALKARIGLNGTDYNLNDNSKSFDVGDSLNITGNYQNLGGSYTVADPANPFLSNLKITKNGKTFLDSNDNSNSGAIAGLWVWTPTEAGTYTVVLTLDKNNAISESSETDNTLEKTITVLGDIIEPDLLTYSAALDTPTSQTLTPGQTNVKLLKIKFTASGNHNIRLGMLSFRASGWVDYFKYLINLRLYNENNQQIGNSVSFDSNALDFFGLDQASSKVVVSPATPRYVTLVADVPSQVSLSADPIIITLGPTTTSGDVIATRDDNPQILVNASGIATSNKISILNTSITYSLSLNPSGANGTIVSYPSGINCSYTSSLSGGTSGSCNAVKFPAGTVVTLTASPASGNVFTNWSTWNNSSGGCNGSSPTCILTMNKDFAIGAIFSSAGVQAASNILIYDIGASYVAADKFNITWTTNGNDDCTVIYSTKDGNLDDDSLVATRDHDDIIYGSIFAYTNSGTVYYYKMDNSMGLSNQGDSNKGYYKIICYDQSLPLSDRYNNRAISSVYSIDLIKISNVEVKNITTNSAIVEWTSNSPDISSILYGTENSPNGISYVAKDTNIMTSHRLYVKNLATNTKYYFQIQSNSLTSHAIESAVYDFTTKVSSDTQIRQITTNANLLISDKMSEILAELNQLRSIVAEQQTQIKYLSSLLRDVQGISAASQAVLNNFITYGVDANTVKLGAGERAAVINSYKSAFDKLPQTEAELADVIKIANGRWPSITNKDAENQAKAQFLKIYKRAADMNGAKDNAAVTIMAYGLRQKAENRNLNSEVNGIKIFKAIYGRTPNSTEDWNVMQAITYSGASR